MTTTESFWNPEQLIQITKTGRDLYSFKKEYDFDGEDFKNECPVQLECQKVNLIAKKRNLNIGRSTHSFLLFSEETSKRYKRRISPENPNL